MRIFVDLHIHSCLSPCADMDMTPGNICAMAKLKGLQAIAITDHNSALNLPAAQHLAKARGLVLLPGLEIATREEVHLLAYFPTVEQAIAAGEFFSSHLPKTPNAPHIFGEQAVMDERDERIGEEERMLIAATDVPLHKAVQEISRLGGLAVPAHINRGANGLLMNLGFLPEGLDFPALEVSPQQPIDPDILRGKVILRSSDAHSLGDILEPVFSLEAQTLSASGILNALLYH
jgi:PHP family Zn ribbon phosphoesterase